MKHGSLYLPMKYKRVIIGSMVGGMIGLIPALASFDLHLFPFEVEEAIGIPFWTLGLPLIREVVDSVSERLMGLDDDLVFAPVVILLFGILGASLSSTQRKFRLIAVALIACLIVANQWFVQIAFP